MELYNGDCLTVLKDLSDNSVDVCILDLPYGQTVCAWDTRIDMDALWRELKRVGKPNTPFIFFTTTKFGYELIKSNEKWFRYDLVWDKIKGVGFLQSQKMPMRSHEMIYVFYGKLPFYNIADNHVCNNKTEYADEKTDMGVYGGVKQPKSHRGNTWEPKLPVSIIQAMTPGSKNKEIHPTEKPVEIIKWLVKYYSRVGDTILDPTMGSGVTGVACRELNRKFIGIERDAKFYELAKARIENTAV